MLKSCDVSPHQLLAQRLQVFAGLSKEDFCLGVDHWRPRLIPRHGFFDFPCIDSQHCGLIVRGMLRVYYVDPATNLEQIIGFVQEGTFITSLKSLINLESCPYYFAALENVELLVISFAELHKLYDQSHGWERFGRLMAEHHLALYRAKDESILYQTVEQRYLALLARFPGITNRVSLGHIASYLGIKGPSLSRIRARLGRAQAT
jgi:CRP-like cAMP-binding protein